MSTPTGQTPDPAELPRYWTLPGGEPSRMADLTRSAPDLVPIVDEEQGGIIAYALPYHAERIAEALNPADDVRAFFASLHGVWTWLERHEDGTEREYWPSGSDCAEQLAELCDHAHRIGLIPEIPEPVDPDIRWVITDGQQEGHPVFWSNDHGWGDLDGATRFTHDERHALHLPLAGRWVPDPSTPTD